MNLFFSSLIVGVLGVIPACGQQAEVQGAEDLERLIERQAVPADVLASAVTATQDLGDQFLQGKYEEVVAKMYPRYQKRAAKKAGGQAKLALTMRNLINKYSASGITLTNFVAEPAMHGFDIPEFNEWLVIVPTTRIIRFNNPDTGKTETRPLTDYEVAIRSKKEGATWSFINGGTLKSQELRSFFPSLPADFAEWAIPQK